jgi:catecholate siderophore receptor
VIQKLQQRKTRRGWEVRGIWKMGKLAALVLATGGVLSGSMALASTAAGTEAPVGSLIDAGVAPTSAHSFDIPAGGLAEGLTAYGAITGFKVHIALPADKLVTFHTNGVRGIFPDAVAVKTLLEGTGLSVHFGADGIVEVSIRSAESVDVTASVVPDQIAMGKFNEPLVDVPQTVEVVPQFILRDEQNRTLTDAVRNVPGISIAAGESGAQGDNLTIRGFTARNDIYLDGIRDFGSYYRDSFDIDQVEVLEGPAGVQFGRGSTGGLINQESKFPQADKFVNVETVFGTDQTRRVTADINEPLPDVRGGTAFRMNVMATEGGVAGRPYAENRRFGLAPSVSFGMNGRTRATISYFHFTENDTPDYGLPWYFNKLAPGVNRHSYFGFPDENFLRTNDDIFTLKANHSFGENVDLHTIGRFANYPRDVQITEPQICGNAGYSIPVGGWVAPVGTTGVVATLPASAINSAVICPYMPGTVQPSAITVNRNQLKIKSVEGDLWDQTEVTAKFKVLGIRNDFTGGIEGGREISNPIKTSYTVNKINTVTPTNLVTPTPSDVFSGTGYIASITHVKSESVGLYFVDTLKVGKHIEASGGVRYDYFDTLFNLYAPATSVVGAALSAAVPPISQTVQQPSYRAAFVFKPNTHGSVYFDYGTSFNPSAESLSLSVSSSILPPEENETYEVGAKYSFLDERLRVEGAVFHTTKLNARETDPTNSNNIILAGNQLVKGLQASAVGRLGGGTDLIVGYAYLYSEVTYSKLFPTSIGFQLANVPKQTFNAFVTHDLPFKLNIGVGGNYVASRTASSTVPYVPTSYGPATPFASAALSPCGAATCYQVLSVAMKQVPGYWVFNAALKRPLTKRIELQANVYNVLNRFYIDQPHPSHLIPGAGASALIGASFKF